MIAAVLAGVLCATALIAYYGFHAVAAQMLTVGVWHLVSVAALQAAILGVAGWAWWLVMPRPGPTPWPVIGARLIREAGSELLPFSAVGGYLMSARALAAQNAWGVGAMASLIVDVTLEIAAQIAFAVIALGLLAWYDWHSAIIGPIAIGLLTILAGTAIVYALQRRHIGLLRRVAQPLLGDLFGRQFAQAEAVQRRVNGIYRQRWRPAAGFLLHLACWIGSAIDIWLALKFMGVSLSVTSVIALEGLLSAVNGAAFIVPNAIGVQEGAYVALGAVFGLGPESALALSLLKRSRDLIVGVPALVLWQGIEARQFWRRFVPWRRGARVASPLMLLANGREREQAAIVSARQ
jgi:putative membrane protein